MNIITRASPGRTAQHCWGGSGIFAEILSRGSSGGRAGRFGGCLYYMELEVDVPGLFDVVCVALFVFLLRGRGRGRPMIL